MDTNLRTIHVDICYTTVGYNTHQELSHILGKGNWTINIVNVSFSYIDTFRQPTVILHWKLY